MSAKDTFFNRLLLIHRQFTCGQRRYDTGLKTGDLARISQAHHNLPRTEKFGAHFNTALEALNYQIGKKKLQTKLTM